MTLRPALFLDRDGVLNHDRGYVHRWESFEWVEGAIEAVKAFNDAGWLVVVVTNQAGVAYGYYDEAAVAALHAAIRADLARAGAAIDAFYYCPFHAEAKVERYRAADHPDRKPLPGMILRAFRDLPVDAGRSFLVGDRPSDLAAAAAAGIPGLLFPGGSLLAFLRESGRLPRRR